LSKSNKILTANASWNGVQILQILWKSRKGYAPAGRLCSTFWSNLSKTFSFGGPIPLSLHQWGEMWHGGGAPCRNLWSPPPCQISPHRCKVLSLWGEKRQNQPLSNLNTGMLCCTQCCR